MGSLGASGLPGIFSVESSFWNLADGCSWKGSDFLLRGVSWGPQTGNPKNVDRPLEGIVAQKIIYVVYDLEYMVYGVYTSYVVGI